MAVAKLPLLGGVALTAAAIPTGLYVGSTIAKPEETPTPAAPELVSLKKAKVYEGTGHDSKFGKKLEAYFLSAKGEDNKEKWEERAKALKEAAGPLGGSSFFTSIKDTATGANLKGKCVEAYGQTTITETEAKWTEVWTYCSIGGTAPVLLKDSTNSTEKSSITGTLSGKVGATKKDEVLSIDSEENNWIWKIKNEEKNITGSAGFFVTKKEQDIKVTCKEAYKETKDTSQTPDIETQIVTYCSKPKATSN